MKVLVSGFEPFLNHQTNPTGDLVRALSELSARQTQQQFQVDHLELRSIVLPVEFRRSSELALNEVDEFNPDWYLMFGLNANLNEAEIAIEENAINQFLGAVEPELTAALSDRPKDNRGLTRSEWTIDGAEPLLKTQLPALELCRALSEKGYRCTLSQSAGTYVCNDLFFRVLLRLKSSKSMNSRCRAGFIHIGPMVLGNSLNVLKVALNILSQSSRKDGDF